MERLKKEVSIIYKLKKKKKMKYIDFYKELMGILEDLDSNEINFAEAEGLRNDLVARAKVAGLSVEVSDFILNKVDDEKQENDSSYESSYSYSY
jgi:hypothetical protein